MSKRRQRRKPTQVDTQEQENVLKTISPEFLKNLPQNTQIAVAQSITIKGPLPPPALYREYEEILPGAAERILKLAENEQAHRHQWDKDFMTHASASVKRGQWMGFGVAGLSICATVFCAYLEFEGATYIFGTISLAGIISAFLPSRTP